MRQRLLWSVALLLVACSTTINTPTTAPSTAQPTYTPYPTYTPAPTQLATVIVTVDHPVTQIVIITTTPQSATTTSAASATASAKTFTAQQAVDAFKAARLDVGNPRPMVKDDYGAAPMMASDAIIFELTSLGPDSQGMRHGRVMAFANAADLNTTKTYYVTLGKGSALLFSWVYDSANLLVQINGDLPEAQAVKYQAALAALTK